MNKEKVVGWILLGAGIVLIVWVLFASYMVFSGQSTPPGLFRLEERAPLPERVGFPLTQEELKKEMERMVAEQILAMFPEGALTKVFNLTAWSIMAGIMIFGGAKISEIGVRLIKR